MTIISQISRRAVVAGGGAALAMPGIVRAQERYPARNVRIVVPFPAGATTDMLARLFAQHMGDTLKQAFVVENIGGAGGSIGADQVAKAAPDGYTLLFHNITFVTTTASLQYAKRAPHDIEADFIPVSVAAYVPFLLLAHPSVPANNLKEFVDYARTRSEPLFYGSTGPGSGMNLSGEILKRDTGIKLEHVPFRGAAPMVQEMLSGRIQFGGDQLSSSLGHVRSGALKPLAVANPTRSAALPDVPTVRELGFPNLEYRGFNGFFAPKGTPPAIVTQLQDVIAAGAKLPAAQKRMLDVGAEPSGSSQEEMRALVREQIAILKPFIEELKLVVQ